MKLETRNAIEIAATEREKEVKIEEEIDNIFKTLYAIGERTEITYRFRVKALETADVYLYFGIGLRDLYQSCTEDIFTPTKKINGSKACDWEKWPLEKLNKLLEEIKIILNEIPNII